MKHILAVLVESQSCECLFYVFPMLVIWEHWKKQSPCMSAHTWPIKPVLILILPLWRHFPYLKVVVEAHDWCSYIIPHVCIHNVSDLWIPMMVWGALLEIEDIKWFKDKEDVFNLLIKWGRGLLIIVEIYISLFRHCVFADTHIFSAICMKANSDICRGYYS